MTPEQWVEQLKQALPTGLRSVVLYGSAAAGDHVTDVSDYNILIVADRLGVAELNALSQPTRTWIKDGNRVPRLFTPEQLAGSADSFPIEVLDMRQSSKVLFGENLLAGVSPTREHLRLAVEREWKTRLLQLREHYLLASGKPASVAELMVASANTFLVLCRAALRLYQTDVPAQKLVALRALAARLTFDPQVFFAIHDVKTGRGKPKDLAAKFEDYLKAIEQIGEAVDHCARPQPGESNP
jgi:hypothetical protein